MGCIESKQSKEHKKAPIHEGEYMIKNLCPKLKKMIESNNGCNKFYSVDNICKHCQSKDIKYIIDLQPPYKISYGNGTLLSFLKRDQHGEHGHQLVFTPLKI